MKKYLSIVAVMAVAASTFAQGLVNFSNNGSTLVNLTDTSGTTALAANAGYVELFWAPQNAAFTGVFNPASTTPTAWLAANPAWSGVAASTKAIGPIAGRFLGGTITVPTTTPGATIDAVVVGWAGGAGSTWESAFTAGQATGMSGKFTIIPGNPALTPAGLPTAITSSGFGSFAITTSVPEPTTLALAGLGAAALLIFRRRN